MAAIEEGAATAPKAPPERMALRAQPRAVVRLNRRMMTLLAGGVSAGVLGAMLWSLEPRARKPGGERAELYNVDRVSRSEGLSQLPTDYSQVPAPVPLAPPFPQLGPPLPGDLGHAVLKAQQPAGAAYASPGQDPQQAERDALHKEEAQALASGVFFRSGGQRAASLAGRPALADSDANSVASSASSGQVPVRDGDVPGGGIASARDGLQARAPQPNQKETFQSAGTGQTRNAGTVTLPASPYQVMAGTVIAGALVTGIQSDLPGDVIASVTEPVYDTATGRHLLIPQGSRILGRYNSQLSFGQSRVQMVWRRIVLPDTTSLTLDNLVGGDPSGKAGLEDGVDWHWDRVMAGAALTTLLGIGSELAAPKNRNGGDRIVIAGRDSLQDSVSRVGQELTRRNLDIQPTLTLRPGLPVRVIVNRDLVLRPYQPLFFERRSLP
ncbi:TrbI/VirB10 family protein [uncultured Pseudacidovorax sp.]|uniref:TrbI/VirB10 family protein n=1 Tax=uncultured Pseudacidovorax sp. TaxID=679313 RepID=UPI0026006077|nr:TrbI/VirB10 family protein [uncultured Pseudacidovorax sp.]